MISEKLDKSVKHYTKPIQNTSSNTHKIPEATGKQPSKEGELKCYECGQKGHMQPQCLKLRNQHIVVVREDDLEEIVKNIEGNLKEDAKCNASEGEIPPKGEENLNKSSGEDKEMYLWDELKYKVNYVRFISDNQPTSVFWEIGGIKAHCLIDSGCEGIMISPNFIRVAKIEPFPLDKPIGIQLAVTGSKPVINYGAIATIKYDEKELKEYFDIVNIDYYDAILGTPFLRKHKVIIDFINNCLKVKDKIIRNQANKYKVGEEPTEKQKEYFNESIETGGTKNSSRR